jgi:hypothetical protein
VRAVRTIRSLSFQQKWLLPKSPLPGEVSIASDLEDEKVTAFLNKASPGPVAEKQLTRLH